MNRSRPSPQYLKEELACAISRCRCGSSPFSSSSHHLRLIHGRTIVSGFRHNLYLSALLLSKYFHFGDARTARLVFDDGRRGGPTKALLWNALIKGYLKHGLPTLALDVYRDMVSRPAAQCEPDPMTFHLVITACAQSSEFALGVEVGEHARAKGMECDLFVGTALVDLHCKAGEIGAARKVFDGMPARDVVAWNAMIAGCSRVGLLYDAVGLFKIMMCGHEILPTESTLVSLVSGCRCSASLRDGETFHAHAMKSGFETNLFVMNSLIEMYVNCNCLGRACQLFNSMETKDAISWSSMIGGFLQHKQPHDALKLFKCLTQSTDIRPSRSILTNVILACAQLGNWEEGKIIEDKYLIKYAGEIPLDSSMVTVLSYMYAKCGKLDVSLNYLNRFVEVREDVIAWNAVMKACIEIGMANEVFCLSLEMQRRSISPDHVTAITLLSAISFVPFLKKAKETHGQIIKRGFAIEKKIANSLMDAYAKSGSIRDSSKVFSGIVEKDVVSWSTMINSYAWNGKVDEVLYTFELMRETEIRPNHFTFLALLSACSHAGLVEKGWELFNCMKGEYSLKPGIEHLGCMVDMFCRAARLADAFSFLDSLMQGDDNHTALWGSLLSACRLHGNVVIGEAAAKNLFRLEPENAANYKMLAEIYISAGRRDDANDVLRLLSEDRVKMVPGFSWYE